MLIEYPITPTYMSHWTRKQALREFLQNAIDSGEYMIDDEGQDQVRIVNRLYKPVTVDELTLLGGTDKTDGQSIGRFGEGFKLAMLVFARDTEAHASASVGSCGIDACINGNNRFELQLLDEQSLPDATYFHVVVRYPNVAADVDSMLLRRQNMEVQCDNKAGTTALLPGGKVFVGGLFVCTTQLNYSYNFAPNVLKLDRDRNSVPTFDLNWETSKLWTNHGDVKRVADMIHREFSDVQYSSSFVGKELGKAVTEHFLANYGKDTIVATSEREREVLQLLHPKVRVVRVGSVYGQAISRYYDDGVVKTKAKPVVNLGLAMTEFYTRNKKHMRAKALREFEVLLLAACNK